MDTAPPGGAGPPDGPPPLTPTEVQLWVLGAHLGPLLLGLIAPLVVLLVVDRRSPYVRRHAVEALNFQVSFLIYFLVSVLLVAIVIGLLLLLAVAALWVTFMVVAAVRSAQDVVYRYPLTFRFFR